MIMTTSEHFDVIADSLADAVENHYNALDALPGDSDQRETAMDLAYRYDRLSDRWLSGMPLDDEGDVALLLDALRASETVCRELAEAEGSPGAKAKMHQAADDYEAARLHMEG